MAFTTLSCVCLVAILGAALGQTTSGDIRSIFAYEYRVLDELIHLKNNQTQLLSATAALTAQLQEATTTINSLQRVVKVLRRRSATADSTYIRWGRSGCSGNETKMVYSGYAAGSWYANHGGAAEYICLPTDPEEAKYETSKQSGAYVYGVEYEYANRIDQKDFFPDSTPPLSNQEVPCAVCMTPTTSLMIPGRKTCYDGWKVEYSGYLNAGYALDYGPSEYICVDGSPEITNGSKTDNHNGKRLFFVEARCGSLPCPPYKDGHELPCVVCSIA